MKDEDKHSENLSDAEEHLEQDATIPPDSAIMRKLTQILDSSDEDEPSKESKESNEPKKEKARRDSIDLS